MWEENQNMQVQYQNDTQQAQSNLRATTNAFNSFKENAKRRINNERWLRRSKEAESLYESSLTSNDSKICSQYDRACKASEMARWIRAYWESQWYDWSNIEDVPLLNQYSQLFPEAWKIMKDYITQPMEDDPMPYYIKLWFEQPTEEDEASGFFEKRWDSFKWSFSKAWQWLRTMYNVKKDSEERIKGNWWYKEGALYDYIWDKYWKWSTDLSDSEWKEVERDLRLNPDLLDKYISQSSAMKDTIMWGAVSALNATPWWLIFNSWITWLASTEPWEKLFWAVWEWAETIWYYANKFPWLRQYRDSLPTDEDKRERDQFVWQAIIALITRWAIKWYKEIKSLANDSWNWWWGWFWWWLWEKFQENKRLKNQNKLEEIWGKISWAKTVQEQQAATRALGDADIKGSRDYWELTERLKKRWDEISALEDIEYAKDERRYKPSETRSLKTFEKDWYSSSVMLKPVEDWIALLKDFYEWSPEKMAQLDLIEQKFINEWLTKWEINNIARAIAEEYDTYKARWQEKTSIASQDVEAKRRAVKSFATEGNENLTKLDKQWSDNMNTRAMIRDLQDAIVKFKSGKKYRNLFQKLWWVAADVFTYFWWKDFLWKIFKNSIWEESFTPVTRASDLKKLTNKFTKLSEKINWAKNRMEAEKIVEEFNKEINDEFWTIEWEVIEKVKSEWYKDGNSYLEDKVEVKEEPPLD